MIAMSEPKPAAAGGSNAFPETPWTVLARASEPNTLGSDALAHLCELYWYPVYAYIRRRGKSSHDAEDLTQAFFAEFLRRRDFACADRERGKLRSFLATSVSHFLSQDYRKRSAEKRGGGKPALSIDSADAEKRYALEPVDRLSPEKLFERRWAMTVLENVLEELRKDYRKQDKEEVFTTLSEFLNGRQASLNYAEAGEKIGLSEAAVKMAVHRMRKRFRNTLFRHIAATVEDEADVEEEIQWLLSAFQSPE